MIPVIIESPYAGDVDRNTAYLRACLRDSLMRGEAPFASHAIYTLPGVLDDDDPEQRQRGIDAGFAWWKGARLVAFYTDLGWSRGMLGARRRFEVMDHRWITWEERELGGEWAK